MRSPSHLSLPTRLCAAVTLSLLAVAAPGWAEHGSPGYRAIPFAGQPLPLNGRLVVRSTNGVAWSPKTLAGARPMLVGGGSRLPLRVVDRFDDMEGHTRPFAVGEGYGTSLLFLQPARRLRPKTRYRLELRAGSPPERVVVLGEWETRPTPDRRPPVWTGRPRYEVRASEQLPYPTATLWLPAKAEGQTSWAILRARPLEGGGSKRLIAAIPAAGDRQPACGQTYEWDHDHGVSDRYWHSDTGRRFLLSVSLADAAGNVARAPGRPLVWMWPPPPIEVCVGAPAPGAGAPTDSAPPVWAAPPSLNVVTERGRTGDLFRIDVALSGEALPYFVRARLVPEGGGPGVVSMAYLLPDGMAQPDCAVLRIVNDYDAPARWGEMGRPHTVQLEARDLSGNRSPAPKPYPSVPWSWSGIRVCNGSRHTQPVLPPQQAGPPTWLGPPTARATERLEIELPVEHGGLPFVLSVDVSEPARQRRLTRLVAFVDPQTLSAYDRCTPMQPLSGRARPEAGPPAGGLQMSLRATGLNGRSVDAPATLNNVVWDGTPVRACLPK